MFRTAEIKLQKWHQSKHRKPLIINGARQIGKSWLIRDFGKRVCEKNFIELNFEKKPRLCKIFEQDLDINRILMELEILENVSINKNTMIFMDEIQQCPKALMALRYFFEDLPEQPVIAAGSLLEFQLKDIPFPVGRVEMLDMFPMTFEEFLLATENEKLLPFVQLKKNINTVIEEKIYRELLNYFWVGGMPACVLEFAVSGSYQEVRKIQNDLMHTYQQDFAKYNPVVNHDCLLDILNSVSNNIGGQIIYTRLSNRFSMPTIKKGVEVLSAAKLITPVRNVSINRLPFTVSEKQFKTLFLDIGLLLSVSRVAFESIFYNQELNSGFTGAWAEQFAGQQLIATGHDPLFFWARTKKNSSAEVDYVIEKNGEILPLEIKAGKSGKLRSTHLLLEENKNIKKVNVFARVNEGREGKLHFLPIYSIGAV